MIVGDVIVVIWCVDSWWYWIKYWFVEVIVGVGWIYSDSGLGWWISIGMYGSV